MDFDPDAYLAGKEPSAGFDPDAYLKTKEPPIPQAQVQPAMEWKDVPGAALKSAPSSALELGKNLVQPIIHPIDTAVNLKNLGMGLLEKGGSFLGLTDPGEHEKYADAVGHHFMEKYGGEENI